jgi:GTPase SAR1 family protein
MLNKLKICLKNKRFLIPIYVKFRKNKHFNSIQTIMYSSSNTEVPKTSTRKKLVIIGDGAVGKTCLIQSFFKNKFSSDYETTVFETYVTNIQIESNDIELVIWVREII